MIEAGFEHTGDPCWPKDVARAWRAMIDAVLKDAFVSECIELWKECSTQP